MTMKTTQTTLNNLTFNQFSLINEETVGDETCRLFRLENFHVATYKFSSDIYKIDRQVLILDYETNPYPIEFKSMDRLMDVINTLRADQHGEQAKIT